MKIVVFIFLIVNLFALEKVSIQFNTKYNFAVAGYIAAKEKGFYKDYGLDVKLVPYNNKSDIVHDVVRKHIYDFGVFNENLVVHKVKGDDIKLVASIFKRSAVVIITQTEITDIKQLEGKKIYVPKNLIDTIDELFEYNDMELDDVEVISDDADLFEKFKNHKIDAKVGYIYDDLYLLEKNHIKFNIINPTDYDYLIYQGELFTSGKLAKDNPILVDRFKKATIKGWYYALDHKEEIVDLIYSKYRLDKSKDELLFEAKKLESIIGRYIYPIGYINNDSLKVQFKQEAEELNKTIDVEQIVKDYVFNFNNLLDLDKEFIYFIKLYNYYLEHKLLIWLSILFSIIISLFAYFTYRLKKEKQKIETLFDKVPVVYIVMNMKNYTVTKINEYALKFFKYQKAEELNLFKSNIHLDNESFDLFVKKVNEHLDTYKTLEGFNLNWKLKKRDKEVVWVNIRVLNYSDNEILWVITDIDDLMRAQKELNKQILTTKKAMKVKEEFLANMSHEIRTPLNAILGFVDIIYNREKDKENKKYLEIINKSGKNLLTIINDILDFSKIESGKIKIEKIEFNPREEFEIIVSLFEAKASSKNITLQISMQNLDYNIISDPVRIKQVISNLISNAIKFTSSGKKVICNINYNKNTEKLYVEVIDEGIGIEEEKLKTIFQPFAQADTSTTRKFGGTGLGLTISKKLIDLLGGELKVESEVNKGSKFYFSIPAKKTSKILEKQELKAKSTIQNFKGDVLIVEDNKANQMFLKVVLKSLGIDNITIANDGEEAIDKVKTHQFDIIFMDENMPKMNGIEASKKIREMGIMTPIVAVTANALTGDKERFLEVMDDYIPKPVDKEKLIEVLSKYLKGK